MNHEIERYLNDHLAGSSGALLLIQHLIETLEDPEAVSFFQNLKTDIESDQKQLERLLKSAGLEPSGLLESAGKVTARIGFLKLMWEGFKPGELGLFEALEMLALGVQGKRLLWVSLMQIQSAYPEWMEFDFSDLELAAIRQRDGVEHWRQLAARDTFIPRKCCAADAAGS